MKIEIRRLKTTREIVKGSLSVYRLEMEFYLIGVEPVEQFTFDTLNVDDKHMSIKMIPQVAIEETSEEIKATYKPADLPKPEQKKGGKDD